jgi:hypothetical protein
MLTFNTWFDASDDVGSILERFLGIHGSLPTCEALVEDPGVPADFEVVDGLLISFSAGGGGERNGISQGMSMLD